MICSIQELDWSKHIRSFICVSIDKEISIFFGELATETYRVVLSENLDRPNLLGLIQFDGALFIFTVLLLFVVFVRIH